MPPASKRCCCSSVVCSSVVCNKVSSSSECKKARSSRRKANNKILDDKYNNYKNDDSRSHTSSPGFIEVLNTSCSSCSSGKDQERASLSNGGGRHLWWGTTHSNTHHAGGMRADGADQSRSENQLCDLSPTFTSETLHCSLSSLFHVSYSSPLYNISHARYGSRVGGSPTHLTC